jgi:hypothetical protein
LSVCEPYASLLVSGEKSIETRHWLYLPKLRGPFLIHASGSYDQDAFDQFRDKVDFRKCRFGYLIGQADLIGVVHYRSEEEAQRDYPRHLVRSPVFEQADYDKNRAMGFILENPHRLAKPVKYSGSLNFFEVTISV